MEKYKVEGHKDLARDPLTGAILNVNDMEHDQYVYRRNIKKTKKTFFTKVLTKSARGPDGPRTRINTGLAALS